MVKLLVGLLEAALAATGFAAAHGSVQSTQANLAGHISDRSKQGARLARHFYALGQGKFSFVHGGQSFSIS